MSRKKQMIKYTFPTKNKKFLQSLNQKQLLQVKDELRKIATYVTNGTLISLSCDEFEIVSEDQNRAKYTAENIQKNIQTIAEKYRRNHYSQLGEYHYEQQIQANMNCLHINDCTDNSIIRIFTHENEKLIQFYGYGYLAGSPANTPYRFISYLWFVMPLKDALQYTDIVDYETEYSDEYRQEIEDCTEQKLQEIYSTYANGKQPKLISKNNIKIDTPDGFYILT